MYTRVMVRLRSALNNVAVFDSLLSCQTPVVEEVNFSLHGLAVNMARHCTHVQYFPLPLARENTLHTHAISHHIDC